MVLHNKISHTLDSFGLSPLVYFVFCIYYSYLFYILKNIFMPLENATSHARH